MGKDLTFVMSYMLHLHWSLYYWWMFRQNLMC